MAEEVCAGRPPRVVIIYASRDRDLFDELSAHLSTLLARGLLTVWHPGLVRPGSEVEPEIQSHLDSAEVILLLVSADLLADARKRVEQALERARDGNARVVPILVRPVLLDGSGLEALKALPDKGPVASRKDRDTAWSEVAFGIAELLRSMAPPISGQARAAPRERVPLKKIFNTYDIPTYSRVDPKELQEIREHLQEMREGLIVDGPSGIGKSTAVRIALDGLDPAVVHRIVGSAPDPGKALQALLDNGYPGTGGYLIIDDFHLLDAALQVRVAHLIKFVAGEGPDNAKIALVGVNPVGDTLVRHLPDLTGRMHRIRMGPQPPALLLQLIENGERAANIEFRHKDAFVEAAAGSFYIAQLLCYEAAYREGVRETEPVTKTIESGPDGYVTDKVLQRLHDRFHNALLTFAACDERPPPRGACLALLWRLCQDPHTEVSLEAAAVRYPVLSPAFEWLMASNLGRYFDTHPKLSELFYYNRQTAKLSAEDPRLQFYLRHLAWEAFLHDTAHPQAARWDPQNGPVFAPGVSARTPPEPVEPASSSLPASTILHLSDLHFGTRAQADEWLGQLADDLHYEIPGSQIDAVVFSGDIANRADAAEYVAAQHFIQSLRAELVLTPEQVILVPGNHDVSFRIAQSAYTSADSDERDEARHCERFAPFSELYREVRPDSYSLDPEKQATLHHFPAKRLLFLGLNSAWTLDHRPAGTPDINGVALGHALRQVRTTPAYRECLKIAVFHHPVWSPEEDRIRDTGFLERLAQAGFRLALHGHLHRADATLFHYDRAFGGRRVDLLAGGTFGAPREEWRSGVPLQYQILQVAGDRVVVHTRKRESEHGAWQPDARWLVGPGSAPLPRYEIALR